MVEILYSFTGIILLNKFIKERTNTLYAAVTKRALLEFIILKKIITYFIKINYDDS